ncbi:site-specific integrase [Endozoicomonas euniceicola]|uniref:Tyr recombinase domain-containing protein n=1 Tax=Endozoicomonas euniceicola TaxID=1234143 RepID=A0ABY6GZH9_9GAMM|nr:hypothetical protein [Endozoicomonas euniceicola]UYM18217.1 hypothetical protein NX720_10035 [Endozoicomonas euniceicola]
MDLILEVKSTELNIFADLKAELEQAYHTACSLTKATIETCLQELPEAEQAHTPLEDRQQAENAREYADKVRTLCRLDTGNDTNNTGTDTANTVPARVIPDIDTLTERCCSNKAKLGNWEPHQIKRNTYRARKVVQMFKASSGITCVTNIEKSDVVQFKETLLETYAISSASTMFNQLAAVIQWVVSNTKYLELNRFAQVGAFKKITSKSAPAMTPDNMKRLLAASPEQYHHFYKLYYFTGVRTGELLNCADWVEVDGVKCLQIRTTKTAAGERTIPLHHSITDLFGSRLRTTARTLNAHMKTIDDDHSVYSFRHGMANRLRAVDTCTDGLLAAVLGHTQKQIAHKVYGTGFDVQRMRKVIDLIPALDERRP